MATQIFVNLPVKDLKKSMDFFKKLGYEFNMQFSDDKAACLVISDTIYAMLVTEPYFATFTKKPVGNAQKDTSAILALSADSREAVDKWADTAIAAGGTPVLDPSDLGFMYSRSIADLDGHHWEVLHMDMSAVPQS